MKRTEKRQEVRLGSHETVFVELAAQSADGQQPAEVLICHSVDLSIHGLKIEVNQPLVADRILNVLVQLENCQTPLSLTAQVCWVKQAENQENWMGGLRLMESDDSAMVLWETLIRERLRLLN